MTETMRILARGDVPSVGGISQASGISRTTFYRVFPSLGALFRELELDPEPDTRARVIETALRLLQTRSLTDLSMDELAVEARVSRANLYRLFPGKGALFRAILLAYSPFEPVMALLERAGGRPPDEVIPELVRSAYRTVKDRAGLVRTIIFQVTSMAPDTQQAFHDTGLLAFGTLARYLAEQMAAGRLRRMHPMIAVQSLIAPVMLQVLGGPLIGQAVPGAPTGEAAIDEFVRLWLRAMRAEN